MNHPLYARWRQRLGPVTMHVEPGKITLANGHVVTTGLFGIPLGHNALAHALRLCKEGDVIGLRGISNGIRIGSVSQGDADNLNQVVRPGYQPLPRVAIVPDDDIADMPVIHGAIVVAGSSTNTRGGVADLTIAGFKMFNSANDKMNVLVEQHIKTGALHLLFNEMRSQTASAWNGFGKMWGARIHGLVTDLTVSYNRWSEANEHAVAYTDNAGYGGGEKLEMIGNVVEGRGGGRTCIQITNRQTSGNVPGGGRLLIEDNDLRCAAGNASSGGGCITIAGHPGPVLIRRNKVTLDGNHSGVVVWSVNDANGMHLTPEGYTTDRIVLDELSIEGGRRPHVAISGTRDVRIRRGYRLKQGNDDGPRTCFDFDDLIYGGPIRNGSITFMVEEGDGPTSAYDGFQSGAKVKRQGVTLNNAQIDAMEAR